MKFPSVSIVSISYNSDLGIFKKTLDAIASQNYPKENIEHIIMDAGSTNGSLALMKRYRTKVFIRKDLLEKPLVRMSLGMKKAKNSLILLLEPDNIMIGKTWLKEMVQPFIDSPDVVAAFSKYNAYEKSMPSFTKYCALFGINDPIVYYLHKSEKLPRYMSKYSTGGNMRERNGYTLVDFNSDNLPTLGDNGHMVRRAVINTVNKNPEEYLHTDAFMELVANGHKLFAVVDNSVIHYTGSSIVSFYKRRIEYKARYFDKQRKKRQYLVYNSDSSADRINLLLFIFYSLTFVQPFILSMRGFLYIPEPAWFLHPIACFLAVCSYGYSELRSYSMSK